jgi:hypothetical protein
MLTLKRIESLSLILMNNEKKCIFLMNLSVLSSFIQQIILLVDPLNNELILIHLFLKYRVFYEFSMNSSSR